MQRQEKVGARRSKAMVGGAAIRRLHAGVRRDEPLCFLSRKHSGMVDSIERDSHGLEKLNDSHENMPG